MPLFKQKNSTRSPTYDKTNNSSPNHDGGHANNNGNANPGSNVPRSNSQEPVPNSPTGRPQLVFHCQLAHGSPTGLISGFSNVRELYQKIAECYELPPNEILFCTLNTHKVDMLKLLGGQIGLDDFIFAHKKGRPKEIELLKNDDALGLTITDNGAGYAFIKRIREGSVIDNAKVIQVGDHIEKINEQNLVGRRHFEVAKLLKEIPKGSAFTLRLVEPQKNGFGSIGPRGDPRKGKKQSYGSGRETLRFTADGSVKIEELPDDSATNGIEKINSLLESFMGINDNELATQIWELANGKNNSMDFAEAIDNSDLEVFGFTDDFVIELWGAVTDARAGRLR